MINTSKLHRVAGIVMLIPLCVWCITGAIFIIKPNYGAAYEKLTVRHYPLQHHIAINNPTQWLEVRQLNTVLGEHLLVKDDQGWRQLNPKEQQTRPQPSSNELHKLITDAIQANPTRYGAIDTITDNTAITNTGVTITVNWDELSLKQRGKDTELISQLYKVHYLQWTGNPTINGILEIIGLSLLILLSGLGAWMVFTKREDT